jgi:hypothetical protein
MCNDTAIFCLHAFTTFAKPVLRKQRWAQYQTIASTICNIWDGVGILAANHSINQKACLGLLPAWCRALAIVDPGNHVVKFFNDKFKLQKKLKRKELDCFLTTVCQQFEVAFDTMFTDRIIENILCKTYRVLNNCDKWCDTLQPGQLLFNFQSNCVLVISPNGENKEVDGDAIVNPFP